MKFWRLYALFGLVFLGLFLVLARLFLIQVVEHDRYKAAARAQHWGGYQLPAARGEIFSADGFSLVVNKEAFLMFAEPPKITDVHRAADQLAAILGLKDLEPRLLLDRQWVALAHKIPKEQKEQIESLGIGGIGFEEEPVRLYPEGTLAAHVLGFVAADKFGQERGYYGVEGYYDGDLRGRDGRVLQEMDATGRPIPLGGYRKVPAEDGADIALTINRSIQFLVENRLVEGVSRYGAESGTVVVMEPQTGKVLAMASFPTFNPGERGAGSDEPKAESEEPKMEDEGEVKEEGRRNLAIAATYEPGSVLKALSMAAAIDGGAVEPQTTFNDEGPLRIGAYTIRTWDDKYHGQESMVDVLRHSCNVGAAWMARLLGGERLREYFLKFGLGKITGIDLEGEDTGAVKSSREWREIDTATTAFGQGISLTPIQLITAFSAVVNGGSLMRPFVVSEVREAGRAVRFEPQLVSRVMDEETSRTMIDMLTAAAEAGEAQFFVLKNYKIAGKTGTAQIPVGGRYDPSLTNATFVGFLPNYPRFVMLVELEKPRPRIYAAETAVPLWMDIAKELTVYYGIEPDR